MLLNSTQKHPRRTKCQPRLFNFVKCNYSRNIGHDPTENLWLETRKEMRREKCYQTLTPMLRGALQKILWRNLIMWNLFSHTRRRWKWHKSQLFLMARRTKIFNIVDTHFFPKESRACANEAKNTSGFESEMMKQHVQRVENFNFGIFIFIWNTKNFNPRV